MKKTLDSPGPIGKPFIEELNKTILILRILSFDGSAKKILIV
jgi:hypothetical protein